MELWTQSSQARFSEYVEALATVLGREDRGGASQGLLHWPLGESRLAAALFRA
jgi:hypothetical protein